MSFSVVLILASIIGMICLIWSRWEGMTFFNAINILGTVNLVGVASPLQKQLEMNLWLSGLIGILTSIILEGLIYLAHNKVLAKRKAK